MTLNLLARPLAADAQRAKHKCNQTQSLSFVLRRILAIETKDDVLTFFLIERGEKIMAGFTFTIRMR